MTLLETPESAAFPPNIETPRKLVFPSNTKTPRQLAFLPWPTVSLNSLFSLTWHVRNANVPGVSALYEVMRAGPRGPDPAHLSSARAVRPVRNWRPPPPSSSPNLPHICYFDHQNEEVGASPSCLRYSPPNPPFIFSQDWLL